MTQPSTFKARAKQTNANRVNLEILMHPLAFLYKYCFLHVRRRLTIYICLHNSILFSSHRIARPKNRDNHNLSRALGAIKKPDSAAYSDSIQIIPEKINQAKPNPLPSRPLGQREGEYTEKIRTREKTSKTEPVLPP